jgi:curved DNA-binding protein CbpA
MGVTPANRPAPSAAGTLAKTPLVHLLLYALERRLGGTIELAAPPPDTVTVALLFVSGQPAKVRTSAPAPYLGRVLLELGHLTDDQLTHSLADLAKAKSSGPALHGQLLLSQGALDAAKLEAGLREQLARKLRLVASLPPETAYAYFDRFDGLRGWGSDEPQGVDPLPMLWTMLLENPPWTHVHAGLARVAQAPLKLARTADLGRLALDKESRAAAELLAVRPMPARELMAVSGLPETRAQILAYLLLVTKQVDVLRTPRTAPPPPAEESRASYPSMPSPFPKPLHSTPSPFPKPASVPPPAMPAGPLRTMSPFPSSPVRPSPIPSASQLSSPSPNPVAGLQESASAPGHRGRPPSPPPDLSPELTARWQEIVDRASTIDRADYFMMLDLPRDATQSDVESAFFGLAKKWHPDRLPADLAPVRDACSRVFGRMSEAHSTLMDGDKRVRYMRLVADGSGSPEMQETVAKVVEAAQSFQKAEVCFKRVDYVQAEDWCRKAVRADPTQPDYHAMLAWLIALKPASQSPEKTNECIRMLDRAIKMSDKCEKAYYWRGALYKRLGRSSRAIQDFKVAADLNPRNIDAAREVRLHEMRGGGRGSSKPPQGSSNRPSPLPPRPDDLAKPSGLFGRLFKKP